MYQSIQLGILGGGQLGKMLIQAAADWNVRCKVLDGDANAPCATLTNDFVCGSLNDFQTVYAFGKNVDVLTVEIENVNTEAMEKLAAEGVKVFPQPHIIRLIQDKRLQKQFYAQHQIPTADFILTDNKNELAQHLDFLPAVHKLGKGGYDGRGVQKINDKNDLHKAFDAPSVLEKLVDLDKEISVLIARSTNGQMAAFPIVELAFHPEYNLVDYLFAPADISQNVEKQALEIAKTIVEKMDFVGLLAVEMFVDKQGNVLVNEIAPRPHNSGHHTIEANVTSQYQQLLRAILGLPLGETATRCPASIVNLLGADGFSGNAIYKGLEEVLSIEGVYVHLYGKMTTKPQRKMGHITILEPDIDKLKAKTLHIKTLLRVEA